MSPKDIPTTDQEAGAKKFFSFLMGDAKTFVLSGGAGVGKTYLTSHLCKTVIQEYIDTCKLLGLPAINYELQFTATTNKAAEVLEQALGRPVQTVHSYLCLKVKENYRTGKTTLEKTPRWAVRSRKILFIDEFSMIDEALYKIILESFVDSKIVFVGDPSQMAPIEGPESPVCRDVDYDNFVHLSKPVRNAGQPALVELCAQLRNTVETGIFVPIKEVPGVVNFLDEEQMAEALTECFVDPNPPARVLCYTNERVRDYNEYIRQDVRGLPETPVVGDVLVTAKAHQIGQNFLSVEREVEVLEVGDVTTVALLDLYQITVYRLRIRVVGSFTEGFEVNYTPDSEKIASAAKALANEKNWPAYFELKGEYADLRDKAACTVYKSQGSTYDRVFIDLGNIGTAYSAEQIARMLFVAGSRATTEVNFFGELPGKYHNSNGAALWTPISSLDPSLTGSSTASLKKMQSA